MEESFVELEKKITKTITRSSDVTEKTAPTNNYFYFHCQRGQQNVLPEFREMLRKKKVEDPLEEHRQDKTQKKCHGIRS